jgi:hypothetical protein
MLLLAPRVGLPPLAATLAIVLVGAGAVGLYAARSN